MFAGASAFAITQAQLADFEAAVINGVQGGDQFAATTAAVGQTAIGQAVAAWAVESPEDYSAWLEARTVNKGKIYWTVRRAVNQNFAAYTAQDAIINNFAATWNALYNDAEAYSRFAAGGFLVGNKRMGEHGIYLLALKRYADVDSALKYVSEKYLADNFDVLLAAIRRAKLAPKTAYELYTKISTDFAQYKNLPKVQANWEALQNDKNEAFMAAYADAKLKALER